MKYICDVCGYEYDEALGDPDHGIAPGTKWEDLPEDFECPLCGVGKDQFSPQYPESARGPRLKKPCASRPFYCRSSEGSLISQSSRGTIFFRPSTVTST